MSSERNPKINAAGLTADIIQSIHNRATERNVRVSVSNYTDLIQDFVIAVSNQLDIDGIPIDDVFFNDGEKIVQNAVFNKFDGKFYVSSGVHDYVTFPTQNGEGMIDGGHEYLRRSFDHNAVEDYSLFSNDPFEKICNMMVWGTFGKEGRIEDFKWVLLKDCESDHLHAILQNCQISQLRKDVINYILKERNSC